MEIKVLGPGCKNCQHLEENVKEACANLSIDAHIVKITDYQEIFSYGIMRTPALVIDGKVVISGQVPNAKQLEQILSKRSS